ncbi:MAG: serine acetyltransferase [Phycisphaerae bacterium]|jgi:serine O-acetyltransferase
MPPQHLGADLPRLVDRLVESYFADERTHRIDKEYLPSTAAIIGICNMLMELTYPGFFGRMGLSRHNISYHVGELLPRLWEQLVDNIQQCLCHEAELAAGDGERIELCADRARQLASQFLECLPEIRRALAEDVQAAYDGDPAAASTSECILAYPSVFAVTIHRYAHKLYELGVPLMPRIMTEHAHHRTGIDIHPGARIGRSFFVDHGTGVVVGETTDIGDHVKLYQGVTLGALSFPKDERGRLIRGHKRHPTVRDNVTVYANAIVLGTAQLGEGSIVGGSVFLTKDVAPGHQVSITPPVLKVRPPRSENADDPPPKGESGQQYTM